MSGIAATIPTSGAQLPGISVGRLARKGGIALSTKLAAAAIALATQIALARMLGHSGYGEYAYAFGWMQLALIFANGGFAVSALRYLAEYRARGELRLLNGFLKRGKQVAFAEAVSLGLLVGFCGMFLTGDSSTRLSVNLLIVGVALPVFSQATLHSSMLRGLGRVIESMLVGLVQPLVFVAALVFVAFVAGIGTTSSLALEILLGSAAVGLLLVVFLQRQAEKDLDSETGCDYRTSEWCKTSTQMTLAASLVFLHSRIGVVVCGLLLDSRAAGTYALAERIADTACIGLTAVNVLAAPTFAAMHAQGRKLELQRYARLAAWGASAAMLIAVLPLAVLGKPLLGWFGHEFVAGYPVLLILLSAAAINAFSGSADLLLAMTGNHRLNTMVALLSGVLNVALSLILVPRYGVIGAAVSTFVSLTFWNLAVLLMVRRELAIWPNVGRLLSRQLV
jgi:O-antigen/teichoic acid export membrane protein